MTYAEISQALAAWVVMGVMAGLFMAVLNMTYPRGR